VLLGLDGCCNSVHTNAIQCCFPITGVAVAVLNIGGFTPGELFSRIELMVPTETRASIKDAVHGSAMESPIHAIQAEAESIKDAVHRVALKWKTDKVEFVKGLFGLLRDSSPPSNEHLQPPPSTPTPRLEDWMLQLAVQLAHLVTGLFTTKASPNHDWGRKAGGDAGKDGWEEEDEFRAFHTNVTNFANDIYAQGTTLLLQLLGSTVQKALARKQQQQARRRRLRSLPLNFSTLSLGGIPTDGFQPTESGSLPTCSPTPTGSPS
jgi:hypothetical protein